MERERRGREEQSVETKKGCICEMRVEGAWACNRIGGWVESSDIGE